MENQEIQVDPQFVIEDLLNRIAQLTKEVCYLNAALRTQQVKVEPTPLTLVE